MTTPTPPSGDSNDRLFIICCHLSLFVGLGVICPLVIYLAKKTESPTVAAHAAEALNFHISLYIYGIICSILIFVLIGFLLLPLLGLFAVICAIMAAVEASNGQFFRYPMTIRFIK
jgi:uncharacterized protein